MYKETCHVILTHPINKTAVLREKMLIPKKSDPNRIRNHSFKSSKAESKFFQVFFLTVQGIFLLIRRQKIRQYMYFQKKELKGYDACQFCVNV